MKRSSTSSRTLIILTLSHHVIYNKPQNPTLINNRGDWEYFNFLLENNVYHSRLLSNMNKNCINLPKKSKKPSRREHTRLACSCHSFLENLYHSFRSMCTLTNTLRLLYASTIICCELWFTTNRKLLLLRKIFNKWRRI